MTGTADRYITRSGRTASYDRSTFADDLLTAAAFLYWAENEYFGGHTGKEAFNAMCRMLDIDPIGLRKAINP